MKQLGTRATRTAASLLLRTLLWHVTHRANPSSWPSKSWQGPRVPRNSHPDYAPPLCKALRTSHCLLQMAPQTLSSSRLPNVLSHLPARPTLNLFYGFSSEPFPSSPFLKPAPLYPNRRPCNGLLTGFSVPSASLLQSILNTAPSN